MAVLEIPHSPVALGLDQKYKEWRPLQVKAVEEIIKENGYIAQVQPTGSGKSLTYISAALIQQYKTVILTSTKALQQQIMKDFSSKVKLLMGQNNYTCRLDPNVTCDQGVCHLGIKCHYKDGGCDYYDAVTEASNSPIVITNYSYWLIGGNPNGVRMLVLDEAHHAPFMVTDYMTLNFNIADISKFFKEEFPYCGEDVKQWSIVGKHFLSLTRMMKESIRASLESDPFNKTHKETGRKLLILERLFTNIYRMEGKWIAEKKEGEVTLYPIEASQYICETNLFRNIPKIVLTSATLSRKTMDMLHIQNYTFTEYPSTFPPRNRKVLHIKTCPMTYKTPANDMHNLWLKRIDRIIHVMGNTKGIIHTGSHQRKEFIIQNSIHKNIMFHNTKHTTYHVVSAFKKAKGAAVLVSPSVSAGFDFPYEQCRYQIIAKIPFPDTQGKVWDERKKSDPELVDYITAQTLVQCCGRGTRAGDDFCTTFIIDDSILWWWCKKGKSMSPEWFVDSLELNVQIPELVIPEIDKALSPFQIYRMRKEGRFERL